MMKFRAKSPFTDEFRAELEKGKYTKALSELDEDEMAALLWAVGEFATRGTASHDGVVECSHPRQIAALKTLKDLYANPERVTFASMQTAMREAR